MRGTKTWRTAGIFTVCLAMACAGQARAQSVQPMRFDLKPSGPEAQTTLKVENNRTHPITIELAAETITLDEQGREVLQPADDFLIFPPQAIIAPGVTQSVRVRYIGAPDIERSNSYRVMVRQIPVDLSGEQRSGVAVAFNFATLAAVVPVGAKPDLTVSPLAPEDGQRVSTTIENSGRAYARVLAYDWALRDGASERIVSPDDLTRMITGVSGLIPPGATRRFTIVLPEGFDPRSTTLSLSPK